MVRWVIGKWMKEWIKGWSMDGDEWVVGRRYEWTSHWVGTLADGCSNQWF